MRDGWSTDFERILPGPDRMYPDTDHPPIRIDEDSVEKARAQVPEFPWERRERLRELGLSEQLVDEVLLHPRFSVFELMAQASADVEVGCSNDRRDAQITQKTGCEVSKISDGQLIGLAGLFRTKRFYREGTTEIIKRMCVAPTTVARAVSEAIPEVREAAVDGLLARVAKENGAPKEVSKRRAYLMGCVMRRYRGAVSGRLLWEKVSQMEGWDRP